MTTVMTLWTYRARPLHVIDGDTIYVTVDHGMRIQSVQSLRLNGVDCPEIYGGTEEEKAAGRAARAFVVDWLAAVPQVDWPLFIQTEKDKQSFNRYVAAVTDVDGRNLIDDIIAAGHGVPGS